MATIEALRSYLLEGVGLCAARGLAPLLGQLRGRDVLLGRSVSISTRGTAISGTASGLDDEGRLLVVVPGGGIAAIDSGHVTAW
jgi:biotin-(acetyl-CoA carboxylase) ligase